MDEVLSIIMGFFVFLVIICFLKFFCFNKCMLLLGFIIKNCVKLFMLFFVSFMLMFMVYVIFVFFVFGVSNENFKIFFMMFEM